MEQQITFNKNIIKNNESEIARLQSELNSPRIRNVQSRKDQIKAMQQQIEQALGVLLTLGALSI